jgi:hypothetical protein
MPRYLVLDLHCGACERDVDPALAAATRAALWEELEGGGHPFTAAHFPGMAFGRLLRGQGRRFVAAG